MILRNVKNYHNEHRKCIDHDLGAKEDVSWKFPKSFFGNFTRLPFLVVDHVLRISRTFCVYVKYSPQSEETFDTVYNVIRHKIVILWHEKVIFVNFYKMKRRRSIEYSVIIVKFALMRPLQGIEKKISRRQIKKLFPRKVAQCSGDHKTYITHDHWINIGFWNR